MRFAQWLSLGLIALSAYGQNAGADRAAALRALLANTPRLPVEQVSVSAGMPSAASLGIVSSVAADRDGTIYALQRGEQEDPVIAVTHAGKVLRSWGKGMYAVPHSIRIDPDGNVWTVDAGNSTLLKFSVEGKLLQKIEVGEVAKGSDCFTPVLCGTTDVTFAPNGRLFISDGYGNGRILEYSADGKRLHAWGSRGTAPGQFQVPHGIANDGKVLYVADRQNSRIQRFDLDGKYLGEWTHVGRPFALKFIDGALWANVMTLETPGASPWILKIDPATGKVLAQVQSPGPHSIDVSASGELVANGCCGGSSPNSFFWLRHSQ